jgi:DNA adenine methylase
MTPASSIRDAERRGAGHTLGAILPWFGSKRTLAPLIVRELGEHHTYFEPFCGSMAVLLAKPAVRMETVNDMHGDLVNLARVIRDPTLGPKLYRMCRRTIMAEAMHNEISKRMKLRGWQTCPEKPCLDRAFDFYFTSWVGRNGVTGTSSYNQGFAARYTPGGGHGATRWAGAVNSLLAFRKRLSQTTILNRDGFDLIEKLDDSFGVSIYCDPPYLVKGAKYVHDFESADHEKLAFSLRRFVRTRIVVSYYEHPRLESLYPGWTKVECPQTKALISGNGRTKGSAKAPEVLLINGESLTAGNHLFGSGSLQSTEGKATD